MNISKALVAAVVFASLLLVACGGGDSKGGLLSGASSDAKPADAPAASQPSGQPAASGATPAKVDVCGLFNAADAEAVVAATKAGPPGGSTMTMATVAVNPPSLGSCKFVWSGTPTGAIQLVAEPASNLSIHRSFSTPVAGIGDEVLNERGTYYLRVGNVMLSAGENSFTSNWTLEMYKRMAPKMK
jgi:hypothetical protein